MHTSNLNERGVNAKALTKAHSYTGWRPDVEVLLLLGVVMATLLLVSPAMAQDDGGAKIRMAHLSPDAPSVMVELDGEPVEALANVSYRDATPYLDIPAGEHDVAVYAAADPTEPVLEVSVAPEAGSSYTVAGVGLLADETFGARLFEDDNSEPDEGQAKVRVIHAVPDVGPATVSVEDGPDLFSLPGFANASDYAGVDAGTYTLEVTPAGAPEPAFNVPDVEVEEGEVYTAFAIGQASEGTLDTMMTVDSDDGRVVGPQTLQDTSGDLSLLEDQAETAQDAEPQAQNGATRSYAPREDQKSNSKDAKSLDKETSDKKSAKEAESKPQAPSEQKEAEPAQEAEAKTEKPAQEKSVQNTSNAQAPVEVAPAEVAAYQAPAPTYTEPPPAVVAPAVETVEQFAAPLVEAVPQTSAATGFVPQPVTNVAAAPIPPVISPPTIIPPPIEVPQVAIPPVSVPPVSVPPVANAGILTSQTNVSTQSATQSVTATSGFVPPVPVAAQQVVSQSQQTGGAVVQNPTDEVTGLVISAPAVVNSGARRKFVTIRKQKLSGSR